MAEKIRDAEDRLLEEWFDAPPIADGGFSGKVVTRIKRRIWVRRLTLPIAASIGGAIAFKPLAGLVAALSNLTALIPAQIAGLPTEAIPQFPMLALGGALLAAVLFGTRILED